VQTVRSAPSAARLRAIKVQLRRMEHGAGLLIIRRSWVRAPPAPPTLVTWKDSLIASRAGSAFSTGRTQNVRTRLWCRLPGLTDQRRRLPQPWLEPLSSAAAPARQPAQSAPASRTADQADGRPGNDFNERADWVADVLGPHGWELHHDAGGVLYVTRPGKSTRGGHTATIGHSLYLAHGESRHHRVSGSTAPVEPYVAGL
jgi:hypothetical protein